MDSNCLNCGAGVSQAYCALCGQAVDERRRSISSLLGDFLVGIFSVDGRFLRTASRLWVPGRLTQLWLEGKRASYVPPVRVYFVASLLFFVFVGFPPPDAGKFNVYVDDMLIGRAERDPKLGNLQLAGLDRGSRISRMLEPIVMPKVDQLQKAGAQDLLDRFFGGLQRTVPTTLIFFVPILAAALKLLFVRQPFYYVDHLVFALHFQSFLFILLVLAHFVNAVGLARLIPGPLTYVAAFALVSPFYMLLALRRVFGQRWFHCVFKTALIGLLYLVLIQPVMLVTFLLVIRSM